MFSQQFPKILMPFVQQFCRPISIRQHLILLLQRNEQQQAEHLLLQKIEFLRDTINISAGGENKTYVSLQDDKALVWAKTGKIILVSEETNIKNVLMAISDAFTALSKATCPPNAPLVTAPCLADFQKVTAEINKFTQ